MSSALEPTLPPSVSLTRRQKQILDFIEEFRRREGISPTHREICDRFGFSSYGTVHKHLRLLREKGVLERERYRRRGIRRVPSEGTEELPHLPFLGRIAAGRPIEAIRGDERLPVPAHLLGGGADDHYVLRVAGQSMIEEGIHDGDYVIVRQRDKADRGQMVVALVDGEATLKRFYPEGRKVRLQPANQLMEPIWVDAETLQIQGVVVGLMRKF
ncbi:MAG: transcriptional repressor LexA [Acidobacteria bacterium]|nr:MAG: transcriptional repressor LexA [Acidobacteriota bacterium]REK07098.1 MAG: transcriptional repressor LexA [Acidobacteriota bacterium]